MNNIHGHRANTDLLQRKGSGYTATHGPDFLLANDSWSQMLNFRYGPDGSVHVDRLVRQEPVPQHQSRRPPEDARADLQDQPRQRSMGPGRSAEAVVGGAGRICSSIATTGTCAMRGASCRSADPTRRCTRGSKRILHDNPDVTRKLRALWALHVTDGLSERDMLESARRTTTSTSAAGRCICWSKAGIRRSDALRRFARMARQDQSALVRLYLASALQRVPVGEALGRGGGPHRA